MEYHIGFEIISQDLNVDRLTEIILEEVEKESAIKIEKKLIEENFSTIDEQLSLSKKIARLKSLSLTRECWRIYLEIDGASPAPPFEGGVSPSQIESRKAKGKLLVRANL